MYGLREQLFLGIAEDALPRGIHALEIAIESGDAEHVERQREESIEFLLRALSLHELADLGTDPRQHPEQILVGLTDLATEEFHDADDRPPNQQGQREGAMQPFFSSDCRTWEVRILHHVWNPRGLAAGPHASGQSNTPCKGRAAAGGFELGQVEGWQMPGLHAVQDPVIGIHVPQRSVVPAKRLTEGLQDTHRRLIERRRFGERASRYVFGCEALLGVSGTIGIKPHGFSEGVLCPKLTRLGLALRGLHRRPNCFAAERTRSSRVRNARPGTAARATSADARCIASSVRIGAPGKGCLARSTTSPLIRSTFQCAAAVVRCARRSAASASVKSPSRGTNQHSVALDERQIGGDAIISASARRLRTPGPAASSISHARAALDSTYSVTARRAPDRGAVRHGGAAADDAEGAGTIARRRASRRWPGRASPVQPGRLVWQRRQRPARARSSPPRSRHDLSREPLRPECTCRMYSLSRFFSSRTPTVFIGSNVAPRSYIVNPQ